MRQDWLPLLIATLGCCPLAARGELQPLALVPVELRRTDVPPVGAPLRVELHTRDARSLAAALGRDVPPDGATSVSATLRDYAAIASAEQRDWLASSFVIDHDTPAVIALHAQFEAQRNGAPIVTPLVAFTADTIEESSGRGWDLASTVAQRREGDCSEHAVLLAALARRAGIPARVVLGVALVPAGDGLEGWGHAWTELFSDGRWQLADAALATKSAEVRYIPHALLDNEGPGFTLSLVRPLSRWVQRIIVLEDSADD